jgi:hypothetical protein
MKNFKEYENLIDDSTLCDSCNNNRFIEGNSDDGLWELIWNKGFTLLCPKCNMVRKIIQ